jgi:diguanylate cyclase (GGDEF)-like protein
VRQALVSTPFGLPQGPLPVTISLGFTTTNGADGVSPRQLLDCADQALYEAKHRGRNRVEYRGLADYPDLMTMALC